MAIREISASISVACGVFFALWLAALVFGVGLYSITGTGPPSLWLVLVFLAIAAFLSGKHHGLKAGASVPPAIQWMIGGAICFLCVGGVAAFSTALSAFQTALGCIPEDWNEARSAVGWLRLSLLVLLGPPWIAAESFSAGHRRGADQHDERLDDVF